MPQAQKWRPETRTQQVTKLVQMSRQPGFDRLSAVVWPETAPPEIIEPRSAALAVMAQAVPPGGLLMGCGDQPLLRQITNKSHSRGDLTSPALEEPMAKPFIPLAPGAAIVRLGDAARTEAGAGS